ncbi:MAG: hypothetical protein GX242_05330, partial [Clostridiales bacterium]|nr:hypothetical protein [Clostridiales bacterium]
LKTAKSIKTEYLEEQYKLEEERKDAAQQQIVRLVESRVEEEKQSIIAQENLRVEQEREAIKKSTARDAVLRIIAAEKMAEDKIQEAERRADDAIKNRAREIDSIVEEEKRKVLEIASQKVVAARAGIEEAAREQIEANKKIAEKFAKDAISSEKDKSERSAARRAVLRIIAAEKAAEEKIKATKEALQQAAVERIIAERELADKEASARYLAEKQAIERAADERIRAEKEVMKKLLEGRQGTYSGGYAMQGQGAGGANYVQPLTIVPYVNTHQPVHQYRPNQVYKFVSTQPQTAVSGNTNAYDTAKSSAEERPQKSKKVRVTGLICLILAVAILALGILPIISANILSDNGIPNLTSLADIGTMETKATIALIGFTALIAFALIALVQSVIRLITGKAKLLGFIIPLIALVGILVAFIGMEVTTIVIVFAALSALLLLFNIIGGISKREQI